MDERKHIRQPQEQHLQALFFKLPHFGSPEWKKVRYSNTLKQLLATPGFNNLKVNEDLCHLDRSNDFSAPTERILAGVSHGILEQKDLLKIGLQGVIDWAYANPHARYTA